MPMKTEFVQDMPPDGGFSSVNFKRNPAPYRVRFFKVLPFYISITAFGTYMYYLNCIKVHDEEIEMRSADIAIYPVLLAERDRAYLKALRRNRDLEEELMKNVKGWEVGKYYDQPLYVGDYENAFANPVLAEYYVHSTYADYAKRAMFRLWT